LAWYEFDPSWLLVKTLKAVGLAKAIHVANVDSRIVEREAA
jgi:fatty-acid desaturase